MANAITTKTLVMVKGVVLNVESSGVSFARGVGYDPYLKLSLADWGRLVKMVAEMEAKLPKPKAEKKAATKK